MRRWTPSLLTLLFVPLAMGTAHAAGGISPPPAPLPEGTVRVSSPIRPVDGTDADDAPAPLPGGVAPVPGVAVPSLPGHGELPVGAVAVPAWMPPVQPQYPYLNAPLYPVPQPNIPVQVGSTLITNQALYPQEMLYPHDYESLYPPYYYRSKGWWVATPFGTKSQERWELLGTRVKVKYRSSIPFWTGFHVPHNQYFDWDENWNNPSASKYHSHH